MSEDRYFTASTFNSSQPTDCVQTLKDIHARMAEAIIRESLQLTEMDLWKGSRFRNPFDFMTETDQWFEWKWRTMYGKERTFDVIVDMVKDKKRIARCVDVSFTMSYHSQMPSYSVPQYIHPTA